MAKLHHSIADGVVRPETLQGRGLTRLSTVTAITHHLVSDASSGTGYC